ncbi:hypothetical protein IM793_16835 [Pedobacter sp. MR2016-19]|uniref:hypothetical protein n=1 Tax=Pedobacter sp. MR2016-19 TaxID=2780089 RepID=UPI0018751E1D|nr:hypothetical protein [Pedobacter sp. MR2016-19]MBE5320837.1 hypothetical protein [Pedobacter sp. MR2016-19]
MKILALRILPPIAIGRLGSSTVPLSAYDLGLSREKPLDFRNILPKQTFSVDPVSGKITGELPKQISFKDVPAIDSKDGRIHPVAPFLEVFALTDEDGDTLVPLTESLLSKAGYSLKDISWDVEVGNIKIFRRTGKDGDKIYAKTFGINSHAALPLLGKSENFLPGKTLPLGSVQFISPTDEFPEVRFRFTPGAGKVYGSSRFRNESETKLDQPDPIINSDDLVIYDKEKGWRGYCEKGVGEPTYTNPAQIFAGYYLANNDRISWGYLDDECDGFVSVHLKNESHTLTARAHISAGPPAFAPDTLPVRVVSDELEQILLGPEVKGEVEIEEAEEIVRRALETIRLMNTSVMNGNSFEGIQNAASTMVRQNTNDFGRLYEPIMATSIVDNLALRALHERVFGGLSTGAAAWFADALRRPDEIGDLSSPTLRKMPALMRGADGRSLTLTHRQINLVIQAAAGALFKDGQAAGAVQKPSLKDKALEASNLTAQLHYLGEGNPFSILPRAAISNCFPGLEFDFRNLWRRAFDGIVLIENNNYVVETGPDFEHLKDCRLVAIAHKPTMVATSGPVFPDGDSIPLITAANPNGVSFMEWSNSMAQVLQKQGQEVICHFTIGPSKTEVVALEKDLDNEKMYQKVSLKVNHFFEADTSVFSQEIIKPGEMTQGLCAPWQNDYRECACYYWAASRPDFVNVVPDEKGLSAGDNWMAKKRTGEYIPDNRTDSRLLSYDDLFRNWEGELSFIIKGNDATGTDQEL